MRLIKFLARHKTIINGVARRGDMCWFPKYDYMDDVKGLTGVRVINGHCKGFWIFRPIEENQGNGGKIE